MPSDAYYAITSSGLKEIRAQMDEMMQMMELYFGIPIPRTQPLITLHCETPPPPVPVDPIAVDVDDIDYDDDVVGGDIVIVDDDADYGVEISSCDTGLMAPTPTPLTPPPPLILESPSLPPHIGPIVDSDGCGATVTSGDVGSEEPYDLSTLVAPTPIFQLKPSASGDLVEFLSDHEVAYVAIGAPAAGGFMMMDIGESFLLQFSGNDEVPTLIADLEWYDFDFIELGDFEDSSDTPLRWDQMKRVKMKRSSLILGIFISFRLFAF